MHRRQSSTECHRRVEVALTELGGRYALVEAHGDEFFLTSWSQEASPCPVSLLSWAEHPRSTRTSESQKSDAHGHFDVWFTDDEHFHEKKSHN